MKNLKLYSELCSKLQLQSNEEVVLFFAHDIERSRIFFASSANLIYTIHLSSFQDGYAVIAADGPGEYSVIAEARAGNDGVGVIVTPGTVAYVTTGGPIPDGADAVVQVEDTEQIENASVESKRVKILVQTNEGVDIRPVGCDIEQDAIVLKSGERVGASEIGLLAGMGVMMVKVFKSGPLFISSKGIG